MAKELHIYPCTDTLLYFPVYMAIENLRFRFEQDAKIDTRDGATIWTWEGLRSHHWDPSKGFTKAETEDLRIILHRAAGGDEQAIDHLQQADPDVYAVSVGDPMIAIGRNLAVGGGDDERLKVLATFINRIAIWAVYAYRNGQKRTRQLHNYLENNPAPLYGDFQKKWNGKVSFCPAGKTSSYVISHFLTPKEVVAADEFGVGEIKAALENPDEVICFTHAPWIADELKEGFPQRKSFTLRTRRWFPPVPFPLSSLIATERCLELDRSARRTGQLSPLSLFYQQLAVAISIAYRYSGFVAQYLKGTRVMRRFRNYGLPKDFSQVEYEAIVERAVSLVVKGDFLSESLDNSWPTWNMARQAAASTFEGFDDWLSFYQTWLASVHQWTWESTLLVPFYRDQFISQTTSFRLALGVEGPPDPHSGEGLGRR